MRLPSAAADLPPSVQRVYFGSECCDRLLPEPAELARLLDAAGGRPVTLVLPCISQGATGRADRLLRRAADLGVDEVVANDLGLLELAAQRGFRGRLAAGRLLNRQRRGPRLQHTAPRMPASAVAALQTPPLDAESWSTLLRQSGVSRVELDLPAVGLSRGAHRPLLPGSLWHPYVLVAVGRFCTAAVAEDPRRRDPVRIWPCGRSCRQTLVALEHPMMPGPLYSRGPAQYWCNEALPDDPQALQIDRIVELPEVPT